MSAAGSKDYPTAIAALNKAIALDPENDQLKGLLIQLTYQTKGADAALATARSFTHANPARPIGDVLAAAALDKNGKRADPIAILDKFQATKPTVAPGMELSLLHDQDNATKR